MDDDSLEIQCVLNSPELAGEVRVTVGDSSENLGTGAGLPLFAPAGFYGGVANPDSNGNCARCVVYSTGNDEVVLGILDDRELGWIDTFSGPARGPRDRFIASYNKASRLELRATSADKIALLSTNQGVELDGAGQTLTLYIGRATITMTPASITVQWTNGSTISTNVTLGAGGASLQTISLAGTTSVTANAAGNVAIVSPLPVTINGVPLTVP
jgi:hypothetical protein